MARHRFSQNTNRLICFVCFFTLHGKQIKVVRSFFMENLQLANLFFEINWPLDPVSPYNRTSFVDVPQGSAQNRNSAHSTLYNLSVFFFNCNSSDCSEALLAVKNLIDNRFLVKWYVPHSRKRMVSKMYLPLNLTTFWQLQG